MTISILGRAFCVLFPTLIFSAAVAQNVQLTVRNGTALTVTNSHFILNNTDLHCDGSLDATNATVWLTGSNNTSFNGAGTPLAGVLNLNTSPASTLTLNTTLQVSSALNFQQGVINLNGQQLQLTGAGQLLSESETSHLTGITGGSVTASAIGVSNPLQLNIGNLGAALTSSANLGNVSISRSQQPASNPGSSSLQGIQRTYLIQPQNNSALNATLRFYYLNEELNGKDPATLTLWKSTDGITWLPMGADTRSAAGKYVEKTGIADLSYWTLSDISNPLPLTLVSFRALCESGSPLLQWQTGVESGLDYFQVEGSTDGGSWTSLDRVAAVNAPSGSSYSYKDSRAFSFYRLKIVNQSGSFSYSPVFRGGCSDIALPFIVYPNPAETQTIAQLSVRQPAAATILVMDMSGKQVFSADWSLQTGVNQYVLPIGRFAAGNYLVTLVLPTATLQTRLIKK